MLMVMISTIPTPYANVARLATLADIHGDGDEVMMAATLLDVSCSCAQMAERPSWLAAKQQRQHNQ